MSPSPISAPTRKIELLEHYLSLSDRATSPDRNGIADVTHLFWPESAFPFILSEDGATLALLASRLQSAILFTGAARAERDGPQAEYFNSIQALAGGEIKESYDKIHLVPFGEYLPFANVISRLGITQFVAIPGGFNPGRSSRLLTAPGLPPLLPLICYESIFPNEVARRINSQALRPGALLNVTNDGWFGMTSGPYQHFAQSRLRSIEQGLPLIRAANTGISAIIDPYGRTTRFRALGVEAVIDGELPKALPPTLFSRFPIFLPLILWISVLLGALSGRRNV